MKKYIIFAPKFTRNNGVQVLYKLWEKLTQKGYDAYIFAPPSDYKCKYISHITPEMRKNDIVVYPEIVSFNPLQFQNVVRYILFYPNKNGGQEKYEDYEVKFTYNPIFYPDAYKLPIQTLDTNVFYFDSTIKKDKTCYFVHKRGKWRTFPGIENMIEINMEFPATKDALGQLLRETKTLYSFDSNTQLLEEALICGCDVKIVLENGFEDYHSSYNELYADEEKDFENFIKITQNMNYTGKIKKLSLGTRKYIMKETIKAFFYKYIFKNKEKYTKHFNRKQYLIHG